MVAPPPRLPSQLSCDRVRALAASRMACAESQQYRAIRLCSPLLIFKQVLDIFKQGS